MRTTGSAGGTEGPTVAARQTIQVACKLTGFKVANGNAWWYRIAQSPWSSQYYVSADAFYNNGKTSGSLQGTPFVDPAVPDCPESSASRARLVAGEGPGHVDCGREPRCLDRIACRRQSRSQRPCERDLGSDVLQ